MWTALKFLKKNLFNLINAFIGLCGIIATIYAASSQEGHDYTIFVVVVASEFLLVVLSLIHLKVKYSYEKENEKLNDEVSDLTNELNNTKDSYENDTENFKMILKSTLEKNNSLVSQIILNVKNISKMNNEFCNKIPATSQKAYHLLETLSETSANQTTIQKEIMTSNQEFSDGLFELYKRYTTHFLPNIVSMIEAYLKIYGHRHKISATIKLFNRPLVSNSDDRSDIIVYSAFRDKRTYESDQKREIGKEPYTIDGNIDFSICLKNEQFIINNAERDSTNYLNEHTDFDTYYNCTAVVAIKVKRESSYKYLGYLCCDCLNSDKEPDTYEPQKEIFTKDIAHLLFSMAQIYGTFLETLDSNWIDKMEDAGGAPSFLSLIFEKTYQGRK